jgi:hypothetical protein
MLTDMKDRFLHLLATTSILIASLLLSACNDSPPGPVAARAVSGIENPRMTERQKPRVTPAEFHARNRMDWVGVAHNKAMDELRAEVRRTKPGDVCKVIARVSVDLPLDSRLEAIGSRAATRKIRKDAFDKVGCRGKRAGSADIAGQVSDLLNPAAALNVSLGSEDFELSGAAWGFVDQVMAAGDGAATAGDLASELSAILGAAQGLTSDELTVLDALASVSLSSFEYWEQNTAAVFSDLQNIYGQCHANGGGESCYYATSRGVPLSPGLPLFRLASVSSAAPTCPMGVKAIWTGDKWGAGVGLTIGLLTRTVQGAIVGLVGGAAAGSAGGAILEFIRWQNCVWST